MTPLHLWTLWQSTSLNIISSSLAIFNISLSTWSWWHAAVNTPVLADTMLWCYWVPAAGRSHTRLLLAGAALTSGSRCRDWGSWPAAGAASLHFSHFHLTNISLSSCIAAERDHTCPPTATSWYNVIKSSSLVTVRFGGDVVRHIGTAAQSTQGARHLFAKKYMHEKVTKCPSFTWHLPEKVTKCWNFTGYLLESAGILRDICQKFFPLKFKGQMPLLTESPMPVVRQINIVAVH